tara:strand:- start:8036 stop:8218 length:183 start_codon:yes stop_codon:yes gene_type:complete
MRAAAGRVALDAFQIRPRPLGTLETLGDAHARRHPHACQVEAAIDHDVGGHVFLFSTNEK